MCEQRHCMIAGAFDDAVMSVAEAEAQTRAGFEHMVASGMTEARCRVCRSEVFHYESGRTAFQTMQEAMPALAQSQAQNVASGDYLEALRKSQH
jgi:shikimate kinase